MPRTFFKIINELSANQSENPQPLYLFSAKKEDRSRFSILISNCDQYCWINEEDNKWQQFEIECLPGRDEGSKIYQVKKDNRLLRLEVPASFKSNVQLRMDNQPSLPLERVRVSRGYLRNHPELSAYSLKLFPINEEAQQQVVLEEKHRLSIKIFSL